MPTRLIVLLVCSMQLGAAAAQDADALSRAQRDADNPLRRIIEASKIKPRARAGEADKPAREPERIQVRARVAAPTASAPPAIGTPTATATGSAVSPAEPVRQEPESQVREVVVPDAVVEARAPVAAVAEAPVVPLQITQLVEPSVPRRLLDKVRGTIEVVVTFTVRPDGSVGQLAVQSSSNPLMNPTVLDAVSQWRYAPIPTTREHAVQLVMRAGD